MSEEAKSIHDQPPPKPNDGQAVWDLVIADMVERDGVGRKRYGTPLQPFNGRDALVDAYQEALDLVVYLRQGLEERKAVPVPLREQVAAFHSKFKLNTRSTPTIPPDDEVRFRARLIAEEFFEVMESLFESHRWQISSAKRLIEDVIDDDRLEPSMKEFVDGLADLDYVVEGARLAFGVDGAPLAAEVQRANMDKEGGGTREDGKILKPPGWTPPDIEGELRKQGWRP